MNRSGIGVVGMCAALLAGFSGCTGYRLGGTLPPGIESVYVATFINETREPQIETQTTRATIEEFQRDGSLRVTSEKQADAILEVTLVDFTLEPLRYTSARVLAAEEYRQTITARIVLRRSGATEEVVLDRRVAGDATFEVLGDLSASKDRALPRAARDLAHDIVESIVEYW